jgi:hypothetical protein
MPAQSFEIVVTRPADLLVLLLEFRDVDFQPPLGDQEGTITGGPGAYLIAHFQPQHLQEQAFYEASPGVQVQPPAPGNETPFEPGAVQSRIAGPSRLVFSIPASESFPYTLEGILDALRRLPQSVPAVSAFDPVSTGCLPLDTLFRLLRLPPPPHVEAPSDTETAIEAPFRLMLSPDGFARWSHSLRPVEHGSWTELWHTHLGSHRPEGPRVRAVWSPDFHPTTLQKSYDPAVGSANDDPFRPSLDSRDRNELVHLTSNHYIDGFFPTPVETERLMLTTLGAWLRVEGDWEPPSLDPRNSLTVEQWRHDAAMGRDSYVRVVYAGYLCPFGHRASLVKVTERKFFLAENAGTTGFVAYLFQRFFLVCRERERIYTHRDVPFRKVAIRTRLTPNLLDPTQSQVHPHGQAAFWPRVAVGNQMVDFPFELEGTDWEGRTSRFTSPLLFVRKDVDEGAIDGVLDHYNAAAQEARRKRNFNGQLVAYAPQIKPRDTSLDTETVTFGAEKRPSEKPHFRPIMTNATVDIPAVNQLTGKQVPSAIEWEKTYLSGTGTAIGNAGQLFARVAGTSLDFGTTETTGGMVAPDLKISGLSRVLGPVGGAAEDIVAGNFKPAKVFGADVKLLGAIPLSTILEPIAFPDAANSGLKVPRLTTARDGNVIRTSYRWQVSHGELKDTDLFVRDPGSTFALTAKSEVRLDGSDPTFEVAGELTHFTVILIAAERLVEIAFDSIKFIAQQGKKVDVAVQLKDVRFVGMLEFVNELRKFIPLDGFQDPPTLNLVKSPTPGLEVGFTQGIPTIGIGIMSIQNVSLGASFYLPFGNAPLNFHFAFCQRHQPFILTVSLFGGGGFFSMDVGLHQVVMIEAALEFGASAALNLGVAKGQASIMGGFYFQKAGANFVLTGYFRAAGSLSVLGIITVSLEFYLGLAYATKGNQPHAGALWGQAKLTVKIKITFFSKSVSVSMEREFAGSDPRFRQLVSPTAWAEYCSAFAAYA